MRTGTGTGTETETETGTGTGTEIQWGWSKNLKKGGIEEEVTQGEEMSRKKGWKKDEKRKNRRAICRANKTRKMLQKLCPYIIKDSNKLTS